MCQNKGPAVTTLKCDICDMQSTAEFLTSVPIPIGRQKNRWESPQGCLMFTVTKNLQLDGPKAVYLNYVISLAVVEAVQETFKVRKGALCTLNFPLGCPG